MEYMLQILVKAILWAITFILSVCMYIQNNIISPTTSWCYIPHHIINSALLTPYIFPLCTRKTVLNDQYSYFRRKVCNCLLAQYHHCPIKLLYCESIELITCLFAYFCLKWPPPRSLPTLCSKSRIYISLLKSFKKLAKYEAACKISLQAGLYGKEMGNVRQPFNPSLEDHYL